jgi:hypothetical protein
MNETLQFWANISQVASLFIAVAALIVQLVVADRQVEVTRTTLATQIVEVTRISEIPITQIVTSPPIIVTATPPTAIGNDYTILSITIRR